MHWRDFSPAPGVGSWQGLDLEITSDDLLVGAPGLRVEVATPGRLRISCSSVPAIWARIHRYHHGLWRLIAPRAASWDVMPPLRASDVAAIEAAPRSEAWWKAWARHTARALVASPRGPSHNPTRARALVASPRGPSQPDPG